MCACVLAASYVNVMCVCMWFEGGLCMCVVYIYWCVYYMLAAACLYIICAGVDLRFLRGEGGSGQKFFKGGLGFKSVGIFIY